jgi:RND family efflux transporter MFP subunit
MRTLATTIGLTALLTVACGGGHEPKETTPPTPVRAVVAAAATVRVPQTVEIQGNVEATRTSAVASRVMAMVVAVHVKPGDAVAAGQPLLEIDEQAARGQEAQARGALAQAEAALALATRNYERYVALQSRGAASELELDLARMQFEQAKGAVAQANGAVEAATAIANDTRVVSPFAGRVAAKLVDIGDLAAPGRPLLMIESAGGRRMSLRVPESVAAAVRVGGEVPVRIDAMPEAGEIRGHVVEMTPGADPMSHTFSAKVQLDGVEVASGLAGRASLPVGTRDAVVVPPGAVLAHGGVTMIVVRDGEGRARSRAVTLGGTIEDGRREVLSGLSGGEAVLVDVGAIPADGAPVEEIRP